MGRGLIVALALSLAINVFAAGFISARLLSGKDGPPGPPPDFRGAQVRIDSPRQLMRLADALPPDSRDAFRAAIADELPMLRDEHQNVSRLRREMFQQMMRDEWDSEDVKAQLDEIRAARMRQLETLDSAFLSAFESLSVEDRRLLLEEARKRRQQKTGRRRPPPPME